MSKKDPYLDFLNTDSLLFGASVGKDPLKFSDPLSFGTSDPLSFGGSQKKEEKKENKDDFDGDSRHSDDDDSASAPPMDYLGYIQVVPFYSYFSSIVHSFKIGQIWLIELVRGLI